MRDMVGLTAGYSALTLQQRVIWMMRCPLSLCQAEISEWVSTLLMWRTLSGITVDLQHKYSSLPAELSHTAM